MSPNKLNTENIPAALRAENSWVGWRYQVRDDKPTKVPFNLVCGGSAKSNDPNTWCSFETAVREFKKTVLDGLGIIVTNGLVGIDLDKCIVNGEAATWARAIVDFMESYAEISPSGKGLRIFCKGALPEGRRKTSSGNGIEMYDQSSPRFLTVTGRVFRAWPIEDRATKVKQLHVATFGVEVPVNREKFAENLQHVRNVPADDRCTLARMWIKRRPGSKSGQSAHNYVFALAMQLIYGFGLNEDDAVDILHEWGQREDNLSEAGRYEPWSLSSIRHKVIQAFGKEPTEKPGELLVAEYRAFQRNKLSSDEEAANLIVGKE
jgi:hypothetical protein